VPRSPSANSPQSRYRSQPHSSPYRSQRSPPPPGPQPTAYVPRESRPSTFFDPTAEYRERKPEMTSPVAHLRSPVMVRTSALPNASTVADIIIQEFQHPAERRSLDHGHKSPAVQHSRPSSAYSQSPRQAINDHPNSYPRSPESRSIFHHNMAPPSRSSAVPSERQPPVAVSNVKSVADTTDTRQTLGRKADPMSFSSILSGPEPVPSMPEPRPKVEHTQAEVFNSSEPIRPISPTIIKHEKRLSLTHRSSKESKIPGQPEPNRPTSARSDKPKIVINEKEYQATLAKLSMEPLSDLDSNEFDAERDQYLARSFKKTSAIVDTEANKRKVSYLQHILG